MKKMLISLIAVFTLSFSGVWMEPAHAGVSASIYANPGSGSHVVGEEFSVGIVVDGGGQEFTSFGASVSASNLTILSISKGSVAQWTTEPSVSSLNFYGAITGQSSNVTVYTLAVKGTGAGTASISISGGSVKQTDGYSITDIFSSQRGGTYQIQEAPQEQPAPTPSTTVKPKNTNTTNNTPSNQVSTPASAPEAVSETSVSRETEEQVVQEPVAPILPDNKRQLVKAWTKLPMTKEITLALNSDKAVSAEGSSGKTLTNLEFNGNSLPNSLVTIYIFSDKITKTAKADDIGRWDIQVDSALNSGIHEAFVIATSSDGSTRSAEKFVFQVDAENKSASRVVYAQKPIIQNIWFWISLILLIPVILFLVPIVRKCIKSHRTGIKQF